MKILSLKSVLLYQLGKALLCDSKADALCFADFLHNPDRGDRTPRTKNNKRLIDWYEISLRKKQLNRQNTAQILYVSALPSTLAAVDPFNARTAPLALSQVAVNRLDQSRSNLKVKLTNKQEIGSCQTLPIEAQLWLEFKIETQKVGWIAFSLTQKGLTQWLQHLCLQPLLSTAASVASDANLAQTQRSVGKALPCAFPVAACNGLLEELLWQAQYTHACCARLENVSITDGFHNGRFKPELYDDWQRHQAVVSLVHSLVDTADSLFWIPYRWPTQQYLLLLKRARLLCQAFEHFYRVCLCEYWQAYADRDDLEIARKMQQQLLVTVTRKILKALLEGHLGEKAPNVL